MADLKELLGEELLNQVTSKLGENKIAIVSDGTYIPKGKFDEVILQKNTYKTQNEELNSQLEALKKSNKGNEELTNQLNELQTKLQDAETKNKDISITAAIKMAALKAKAIDADVVSMLIDKSKVKTKDDGTMEGLDEQIKGLSESKGYLFGDPVPPGGGGNPAGGGGNAPKDPDSMTMDEYAKWYDDRNKK